MATHATTDNERTDLVESTLDHLMGIDLDAHRIIVSDNGSNYQIQNTLSKLEILGRIQVIRNGSNIGTAKAINKVIALRRPGEIVCKADDDIIVPDMHWPDLAEWVMHQEPLIGILGLKRKDLEESPTNPNGMFRSRLAFAKREKGDAWVVVEHARSIIGTCIMMSPALLNTVGFLHQPGVYGYDDVDISLRARLAGFHTAFLPSVEILHPDPGGSQFCQWKIDEASKQGVEWSRAEASYISGETPLYRGI